MSKLNAKDLASGLFFIAVGLVYGGIALRSMKMGTAFNMGPGYFPVILSGALILLGAIIVVKGFSSTPTSPFGAVPWRAVVMLSLSTVIFAAFIKNLGILPGIFATAFVATQATSGVSIRRSLITSLGIAVFCTVVFGYIIQLPLPVIGPIFRFWG